MIDPGWRSICRIEIAGGIAAGKTTLAQLLSGIGAHTLYEEFLTNPFLGAFYEDRIGNAFEAELTFLLQHFHQAKLAHLGSERRIVCDYSFVLDLAYADVTLTDSQSAVFSQVHMEVTRSIPSPTLIILLECSAQEQLGRIRRRARAFEESIDIYYLIRVNEALEKRVSERERTAPVLRINSERLDFAANAATREWIGGTIYSILRILT